LPQVPTIWTNRMSREERVTLGQSLLRQDARESLADME